jgi:hypothetical protein
MVSLPPNWLGRTQVRHSPFDGDMLTLSSTTVLADLGKVGRRWCGRAPRAPSKVAPRPRRPRRGAGTTAVGLRPAAGGPTGDAEHDRAVAQFGSALDWGSSGRRFKSCQPDAGQSVFR